MGLKRDKEEDDEAKKGQISTTAVNAMIDGRLQVTQLFHFPVPMELTLKTLALAKELGCVTNYYIDHEIYAQPLCDSHYKCAQRYSDLVGVKHTYCSDDYKEAMSRGLSSKLIVLCEDSDLDNIYEHLSTNLD